MYDRLAAGQSGRETAHQPAQILVRQCRRGHQQRRLRSNFSFKTASAFAVGDAGDRLDPDLPLPCQPGPDAPASNRHRTVQICRLQAEPVDHRDPQFRLLETRSALPRRHRIPDHQRCLDPPAVLYCRERRRVFRGHDAAIERCQEPVAPGDLRSDHPQCQPQSARQPRRPAVRQARFAARDDARPRPAGIRRHHRRRSGDDRRGHAAAAGGGVGHAGLCVALAPGLRPRCRRQPHPGAKLMEKLGYGPDNRLKVTVATRNVQAYRDAAVVWIGQMKEIYIDAVLDPIDTTQWYPMLARKNYKIAVNVTETAVDDPDVAFYENYVCGALRNYTGYCNPEIDKLVKRQSVESNFDKRRKLVWEIEKKLIEDDARPILFYTRAATCREPYVKGITTMVNSIYNSSRFEEAWLDK